MSCRNGAEKLLGVLITVGQAVAYVVAGMYGDLRDLGAGNAILIVLQVRAPPSVRAPPRAQRARPHLHSDPPRPVVAWMMHSNL